MRNGSASPARGSRGTRQQEHDERNPPPESGTTRGSARGSSSRQQPDRNPFLKPEHFPGDYGIEYDITLVSPIRLYTGGKFGDQLIVGVDRDGKTYDWSIKIGGQQFMRLEKKLGKDLIAWPHRTVAVAIASYNDNDYIEVIE